MPELKWKSFAKVSPGRGYLALISYLPLKSFWKLPEFIRYTVSIQAQLKESKGLVGYSLLAHLLQTRFWTLSVWEDEHALMEFVRTGVPQANYGRLERASRRNEVCEMEDIWLRTSSILARIAAEIGVDLLDQNRFFTQLHRIITGY